LVGRDEAIADVVIPSFSFRSIRAESKGSIPNFDRKKKTKDYFFKTLYIYLPKSTPLLKSSLLCSSSSSSLPINSSSISSISLCTY
jgi:hypothetical protein